MATLHLAWQSSLAHADELGESPFWHPAERRLYWVDIPGRQLRRLHVDSNTFESWPMPQEPGCIAPARSGGLVVALRDGIYRATDWRGPLRLLHAAPYDTATTRFNDGKADAQGRFWAGTLFEPKHTPAAELLCLDPQIDALVRKAGDATTGNGLAWSPDARTLYWSDTQAHVVRAWHFDAAAGAIANPRVLHRFAPKPPGWQAGEAGYGGRPDGAAVDSEGNYWCALFEGARLVKLSPAGDLLTEVPLPVQCPTMPCFGGDDLRTLFVTTAGKRPDAERARHPLSGHVLAARVDVPGLPVNFFNG
jgi:sugar lactone lactonase YvrE